MHMEDLFISGIVFKDGDQWTSLCLQYDITAQASTLGEAIQENKKAVALYLKTYLKEGKKLGELSRPAPHRYWLLYFWLSLKDVVSTRFNQQLYFRETLPLAN